MSQFNYNANTYYNNIIITCMYLQCSLTRPAKINVIRLYRFIRFRLTF